MTCRSYQGEAHVELVDGVAIATQLDSHIHFVDELKAELAGTYDAVELCPDYQTKVWHGRLRPEVGKNGEIN